MFLPSIKNSGTQPDMNASRERKNKINRCIRKITISCLFLTIGFLLLLGSSVTVEAGTDYFSTDGSRTFSGNKLFTPSSFTFPTYTETDGVYKTTVRPASAAATLIVKEQATGIPIPVSSCSSSSYILPAEYSASACFLIYAKKGQTLSFTYSDLQNIGGGSVLYSDFYPDDINFYLPLDWSQLSYKRKFIPIFDSAFYGFHSELGNTKLTVRNSIAAIEIADALISLANSKPSSKALDKNTGKFITLSPSSLSTLEVNGVLNDVASLANGTIDLSTTPQGSEIFNPTNPSNSASSQATQAALTFVQYGYDPAASYKLIASNFIKAGVYGYGVFKVNNIDKAVNAYLITEELLNQQINTNTLAYSTSTAPLPNLELRMKIRAIASLHGNGCLSWTQWTGNCGWTHYDENYVVALYNKTWLKMSQWIANRKLMGNPYIDVDNDGLTNIEEVANGTDPNTANNPIVIIPNKKPVAVIAPI